jgi:predicted amidohydrolase
MGDPEANREKLTSLVREAAGNGAKIVVLPEAAISGYLSQDLRVNWHAPGKPLEPAFTGWDPELAAEPVPGPYTEHFAALADELDIYLTIPFVEEAGPIEARIYYNTVCLASPDGEIVAHYRKLNPWDHAEKSWAEEGDLGLVTADTEYGRVGMAICYDIHTILKRYEPYRIWALLYPIAWVWDSDPTEWFQRRLPSHVAAYDHHLIGANWSVDVAQRWHGYGHSLIVAPSGKVLARAKSSTGDEIIYATLATASAAGE